MEFKPTETEIKTDYFKVETHHPSEVNGRWSENDITLSLTGRPPAYAIITPYSNFTSLWPQRLRMLERQTAAEGGGRMNEVCF